MEFSFLVMGGSSDNFHVSYFNSFFILVFCTITNIIFAYPQPVSCVPPEVRVPQVGKH
jgi:hypothetical protein